MFSIYIYIKKDLNFVYSFFYDFFFRKFRGTCFMKKRSFSHFYWHVTRYGGRVPYIFFKKFSRCCYLFYFTRLQL